MAITSPAPSHCPASLPLIEQLLDKLGSDDRFREQMIADPGATLKGIGMDVAGFTFPATRTLPAKEVIQANRALLEAQAAGNGNMVYFFLDGRN